MDRQKYDSQMSNNYKKEKCPIKHNACQEQHRRKFSKLPELKFHGQSD